MKLYDVHVYVYAGYKADERPRDFTFKEKEYSLKNIIPQTYEENIPGRAFTVETDEGPTFKHCYDEIKDRWFMEDPSVI